MERKTARSAKQLVVAETFSTATAFSLNYLLLRYLNETRFHVTYLMHVRDSAVWLSLCERWRATRDKTYPATNLSR